jgi:hypothetical protein
MRKFLRSAFLDIGAPRWVSRTTASHPANAMKTKPAPPRETLTPLAILAALAIAAPSLPAITEPGRLWDRGRLDARYMDLHAAATNGSRIVAVGVGGVIRTSDDDGLSWDSPEPDIYFDLEDVIWDGTRFIAVGGFSFEHGIVLTSPDGDDWSRICLGSSQQLHSVCSSGSVVVAMGNNGRCHTSANTTAWSFPPPGLTDDYFDCAWTGSQFVRVGRRWVGGDLLGLIETSPDGTTWTLQRSVPDEVIEAITWSGSLLVAVGEDEVTDTSLVLTSPDGVAWTKLDMSTAASGRLRAVTRTTTHFVACGRGSEILTSTDASEGSWSVHSAGNGSAIYGLLWTGPGGHLFALGASGLILQTAEPAPDDPLDWSTSAPQEDQPTFYGFAQHPASPRIIAVGSNGAISYSDDDGITGNDVGSVAGITSIFTAVTATDLTSKRFIAVSDAGEVISSSAASNGGAWDFEGTLSGNPLRDVTWAAFAAAGVPSRVIAVGDSGTFISGDDSGGSFGWVAGFIPGAATTDFHGITHGKVTAGPDDSLAVAVGTGGAIFTSPDGVNWTPRNSGTAALLYDVTPADIDNGGFMAVGSSGTVLVSKDGINWDSMNIDVDPLMAAAYTGSQYVAVGWRGSVFTSPDASSWTQRHGKTQETLRTILASGTGRLVAGGTNGVVTHSDPSPDFANWMASQPHTAMDGPEDDPNGDGIDNLTAYAFGIPAVEPPTPDDLARLLRWADADPGEQVRLSLGPNQSDLPDVHYILEASQNLADGSWAEIFRHAPGQECGTGSAHVYHYATGFADLEIPEITGSMPAGFYRLRLELIP